MKIERGYSMSARFEKAETVVYNHNDKSGVWLLLNTSTLRNDENF